MFLVPGLIVLEAEQIDQDNKNLGVSSAFFVNQKFYINLTKTTHVSFPFQMSFSYRNIIWGT